MSVGYLNVKDKKPSRQHDMHFFMEGTKSICQKIIKIC